MIQTRNLAFAHPGTTPLVFADLDVPQGGTLLRSVSGAGKSTWLSLAALGETLDGLPGVSSTYFGPNASRPVIRGPGCRPHPHPAKQRGQPGCVGTQNGVTGRADVGLASGNCERGGAAMVEGGNERFAIHVDAFDRRTGDVKVPLALDCENPSSPGLKRRICNSASDAKGGAVGGTLFFDDGYLGASASSYRNDYGTVAEDNVTIGMRSNRLAYSATSILTTTAFPQGTAAGTEHQGGSARRFLKAW